MTFTITIIGLAAGTYLLKSAAPLLLGGRRLPGSIERLADLLPVALLAALVVVSTFTHGRSLAVDARAGGLAAAAFALVLRAPFVVVVLVAAAVTATIRMV